LWWEKNLATSSLPNKKKRNFGTRRQTGPGKYGCPFALDNRMSKSSAQKFQIIVISYQNQKAVVVW